MTKRILFLTAQLQPFLCAGINAVMERADVEILVYTQRRPENDFLVFHPGRLRIFTYDYEPETFFWKEILAFDPDTVFCAGWMYRRYVSWCQTLRGKGAATICAMDTQWKGLWRQHLLVKSARFFLLPSFSHAWVPGNRQDEYARRLGFPSSQILNHLYATDTRLFAEAWGHSANKSEGQPFPRQLLYAGRLEPHKVENLVRAFRSIPLADRNGWHLTLVGNGSLSGTALLSEEGIRVYSHMQQRELAARAALGGVFCLCSSDEPWGMVIQEFAAAGMPLLVSAQSGASDHFLKDNGWLCNGGDVEDIRTKLHEVMNSPDARLYAMAVKSHHIAMSPGPADWAGALLSLV